MANASIVLVGLGAQVPNPGVYVELDFARGPIAGSGAQRSVLLMGNATSAGTATRDTVVYGAQTTVPCQTENDVITLFGPGSQLHRMFLAFVAAAGPNNTTPLYFLAVTSSGGTAASIGETIATTATATGNHRFWCGGALGGAASFVDTTINVGDSPTVVATNIVASINSQTRWPVTAANTAGVITITAKSAGPEGNWIRVQAALSSTGVLGTTTTLTANTFLTSGATADVNTTALGTIVGTRYYYIVSGDSDATNVGRLVTQVGVQAVPTTGIRQRAIFGSMDTLANTITVATGVNNARSECVWGNATDYTPAELAAGAAGLFATLEQGSPYGVARKNFSLFPSSATDQAYWPFSAGRAGVGGAPTQANITAALNNGISPITVLPTGSAQFVKRCTTYSLNGAISDYRIRDAHKVSVCDYWCDDVQAMTQAQFGGRDLLPDPVPGQPPPGPQAVTPRIWGNAIKNVTLNFGSAGQWTYPAGVTPLPTQSPADVINAAMIGPQIETNPTNRMSVSVGLAPVAIFDQAAVLASQIA
jgi:phage tail sheath gpL-like